MAMIIAGVTVFALSAPAGAQVVSLLQGNAGSFAGLDSYLATNGAYQGVFASGGSGGGFSFFRYGPDNNLYIWQGTSVLKYNGHTGNQIGTFTSVNGLSFAFGPDNNMYRLEPFSQSQLYPLQIGKYDGATGVRLGTFVSSGSSGITSSDGNIRFGPDSNLYVDNTTTILRFNGTTGAPLGQFTPPGAGGLVSAADFLFTSDGKLLISGGNDTIYGFNGTTGAYTGVFASGNGLNVSFGLAEGSDGNVYVASEFSHSIKRFNLTTGAYVGDFVPAVPGGRFPSYLEFSPFPIPEPTSVLLCGLVLAVGGAKQLQRRFRCLSRNSSNFGRRWQSTGTK
jgi:hypothetical protein